MLKQYCAGYMTWRHGDPIIIDGFAAPTMLERHYAVHADGRIVAAEVKAPTIHFGKHADGKPGQWVPVSALPENAEFIGTYPAELA